MLTEIRILSFEYQHQSFPPYHGGGNTFITIAAVLMQLWSMCERLVPTHTYRNPSYDQNFKNKPNVNDLEQPLSSSEIDYHDLTTHMGG